jgi:hypothetical protein
LQYRLYQTYHNSQEEIDLVVVFDSYRLGEISNNITLAEPIFRDADVVSLDLNSIKSSDSGNFISFAPNGFNGKEICSFQICGISDKVSIFGIFNHNNSSQESVLIAQIIWYFIGFIIDLMSIRSREKLYKIYRAYGRNAYFFIKATKRTGGGLRFHLFQMVIINKKEIRYYLVLTTNIWEHVIRSSERWWKAQRKNSI